MNIFDRISFYIFLTTVFLLPFFFIPTFTSSLSIIKGFLFVVGVILAFIFWLIARLTDGDISIPRSPILLSGLFIVLVYGIATIFSPAKSLSFIGSGFEVVTMVNILLLFVLMFLASVFIKEKSRFVLIFVGLGVSYSITALISLIVLVFGPESVILKYLPFSTLGSLSDLSIYSGLILIFAILALQFLSLSKVAKVFIYVGALSAVFLMLVLGYYPVWIVVGITAFVLFIYGLLMNRSNHENRFPTTSFLVGIISLIFILTYNIFGVNVPNYLRVNNSEIRPSIGATFQVSKEVFKVSPVVGIGPVRFSDAWNNYKPNIINQTDYWDTSFSFGYGLIPSTIVTVGSLGFLTWLIFSVLFLVQGLKKLVLSSKKSADNFLIIFSSIGGIYLLAFTYIYAPNIVLLTLLFTLIGIFIGSINNHKKGDFFVIKYLKDARIGFLIIFILIALIAGSSFVGYKFTRRIIGTIYYAQAITSPNTEEGISNAQSKLVKAINQEKSDIYFRALAQVYLIRINVLISKGNLTSEGSKLLEELFNTATESSRMAILNDKTNYLNWVSYGSVSENAIAFKIKDSYDNAKVAYTEAIKLNPKNPGLYILMARLEYSIKNNEGAILNVKKALELKPNYPEAQNILQSLTGVSVNNLEEKNG